MARPRSHNHRHRTLDIPSRRRRWNVCLIVATVLLETVTDAIETEETEETEEEIETEILIAIVIVTGAATETEIEEVIAIAAGIVIVRETVIAEIVTAAATEIVTEAAIVMEHLLRIMQRRHIIIPHCRHIRLRRPRR